jgi:hypothetical protein
MIGGMEMDTTRMRWVGINVTKTFRSLVYAARSRSVLAEKPEKGGGCPFGHEQYQGDDQSHSVGPTLLMSA